MNIDQELEKLEYRARNIPFKELLPEEREQKEKTRDLLHNKLSTLEKQKNRVRSTNLE